MQAPGAPAGWSGHVFLRLHNISVTGPCYASCVAYPWSGYE